jgi:hypothetical protein
LNEETERFVAHIHNTGALVDESKMLIEEYLRVGSMEGLRQRALVDNILGKKSRATVEKILFALNYRYLNSKSKQFIKTPFLKVMESSLDESVKRLIMYYHFSISDRLVYVITTSFLFERFSKGYVGIAKTEIDEFLRVLEKTHSEILSWSPQTRQKLIRHYLAALKDFGILLGHYKKEFNRVFVPPEVFFYVFYYLKDQGRSKEEIIESEDWRAFLLDSSDVTLLLNEGNKLGYIKYEVKGNILRLEFPFRSLEEFVNGITRK